MVKLGVDVLSGNNDAYSGYWPSGNVTGVCLAVFPGILRADKHQFSMMHESGTGGSPKYGVASQLPAIGTISNPLLDLTVTRASADQASLGNYKVKLSSGVTVDLAASTHAAVIQHTFPDSTKTTNVVVDVSHYLPDFRGLGFQQSYVGGGIEIGKDGSYTGYGVYNGGWNYGELHG